MRKSLQKAAQTLPVPANDSLAGIVVNNGLRQQTRLPPGKRRDIQVMFRIDEEERKTLISKAIENKCKSISHYVRVGLGFEKSPIDK